MLLTALIPLLGGLALPVLKFKSGRLRLVFMEAVTILTSAMAFMLVLTRRGTLTLFSLGAQFSFELMPDGVGKVFLGLIAFLWPLAMLYADEYMEHEERQDTFFCYYLITYAVMVLLCCARNLFTLYIMYELLTMATLPLVLHVKDHDSVRASHAYVIYSIGGAGFAFASMMILSFYGLGEFGGSNPLPEGIPQALLSFAYIAGFFGFGVKAAVFPLSRWLPKACAAPTPVTALLHAVAVVNTGIFAVLRLTYSVFDPVCLSGTWPQYIAMTAAALTVLAGAVQAVRETHVKRRLAYSTVSNLGYMLFGITLMTEQGQCAALMHMLCHSMMKIALFYCIGAVIVKTGRTGTHEMHGLAKKMPFVFLVFVAGAIALSGIPPLSGFAGKFYLIRAALEEGSGLALFGACTLLISSILTMIYTLSMLIPAYTMPPEGDALPEGRCDPSWRMKLPLIVFVILMIVIGVNPKFFYGLIESAVL